MRTEKVIVRKIEALKGNANMIPALYRLFTYIRWEAIPEEYQKFYPKEAKETWNDDLKTFDEKFIKLDLDTEVKAVFRGLFKSNITQAFGIVPIILADVYMLGKRIARLETKYMKMLRDYMEYVTVDRDLAEQLAVQNLAELLNDIVKHAGLNINFDIVEMTNKVLAEVAERQEKQNKSAASLDDIIDKALAEYDEKHEEETNV